MQSSGGVQPAIRRPEKTFYHGSASWITRGATPTAAKSCCRTVRCARCTPLRATWRSAVLWAARLYYE